jgi:pimeloyl-ACP methyl ester carboxylesterase
MAVLMAWTAVQGRCDEHPVHSGGTTNDYAVLLHGLGRTRRSMRRMNKALRKQGYTVVNIGYPSTREEMPELVAFLDRALHRHCTNESARIHFVTHSLGGILTRAYLAKHPDCPVGRVVMLSPPSSGSEVADRLKDFWPYRLATGPMGQQIGTGEDSLPSRLPPISFELGIITGDRTWNPLYSAMVQGVDDGKVAVSRARAEGMRDFLVVHASHTWIMQRKQVIDQVVHFLANGTFRRPAEE